MLRFIVTYDYLCPFARNANEAVLSGLEGGKDWEVGFRPFSLNQVHVHEGDPAVWDRPPGDQGSGVLALQWGLAVRDEFPEAFGAVHRALFAARHDNGGDLRDPEVLETAVGGCGLDSAAVAEVVATGKPLDTLRNEHTYLTERWRVFGVPTFIIDDDAVFVRLMERDQVDELERMLGLVSWTGLNEFKRTTIPR
ncbi:MAG TPA: DsbA family protein [Acidimicrobiia bacterium]|jgi:protein-disulfide isomerase-like protein with CxxC motif|nr:DsbA family protein [Acidimicrobiia bacterium]